MPLELRKISHALGIEVCDVNDALPNVPSLSESGIKGFDATAWVGLLAPVKIERNLIAKLNRDVRAALADADVRKQIEAHGLEVLPSIPQELARHMDLEIQRWAKVIKDAGVRAE